MKKINKILLLVPVLFSLMFSACESTTKTELVPVVTTTEVSDILITTATSGGNLISDGGSTVTARGVCWSSKANPTITDNKSFDGYRIGSFTSYMTGLQAATTYYLRAYATNSTGTGYGDVLKFTTAQYFTFNSNLTYGSLTDIDGNVYKTITIGTQTWMAENLRPTKYKDGTAIPLEKDNIAWTTLTTPGYCWYDNDPIKYKNTYGALYNWFVVNTGKLAPNGWHVPTYDEWTTLHDYVGANLGISGSVAKALAAANKWIPDSIATAIGTDLTKNNSTGFSALPGGDRHFGYGGIYMFMSNNGYWWSYSEYNTNTSWFITLFSNSASMYKDYNKKSFGFSVRCVKDTQ